MAEQTLLRLTGISKSFGGVRALKGVSFDLRAGEVHALVGENGAGKSTLIKIITGAHQPDEGTLEILGRPVSNNDPGRAHALGVATQLTLARKCGGVQGNRRNCKETPAKRSIA